MEKLVIAFLLCGSLVSAWAQEVPGEFVLKGKVREMTVRDYKVRDSAGVIIKAIEHTCNSNLKHFFFNAEGLVTKESYSFADSSRNDTWVFNYDSLGRKTEVKVYDHLQNLNSIYPYTYSADGRKMTFNYFSAETDKDGNVIRQYSLSGGCVSSGVMYSYNRKGQVASAKFCFPDNDKFVCGNDFDWRKVPIVWNKPDYEEIYTYDNLGNVTAIKYVTSMEMPKKIDYVYEFDEQQNWVIRKQYVDGELFMLTEREIKYY